MTKLRYLYLFMLMLSLAGCTLFKEPEKNGADLSTQWIISDCGKDIKVTNQSNPIVLYGNMVRCIEHKHYDNGVMLFSLAGTYSYFDTYRTSTGAKTDFHNRLLKNAMQLLDKEQKNTFGEALNRMLTDKSNLKKICSQVKKIGMPMYIEDYMNTDQFFRTDIDAIKNWESALEGYLHCSR